MPMLIHTLIGCPMPILLAEQHHNTKELSILGQYHVIWVREAFDWLWKQFDWLRRHSYWPRERADWTIDYITSTFHKRKFESAMFQVDHFDSKMKFGAVVRPCWPHPGGQWFEPWLCGKKSGARSLDFGPSQPNLPPNFTFLPHQYFYCPCLHSSFPPPVWSLLSIFCFVSVSWQKHHLPISKPIIQPNQRIYVLTRTSFMVPVRNLPASFS